MAGKKALKKSRHGGGVGGKPENTGAESRLRLFVAIELPAFVSDALAKLQAEMKQVDIPVRWLPPENIHLTLKFLGETPVSAIKTVESQLSAAAGNFSPIQLRAQGLSVFPGPRRARVLWTGTGGETDRLAALQKEVEERLAAIGFEKENRPFTAHLTLARFKGKSDPETVISLMHQYGDFASAFFSAGSVCLFESRLTSGGAVYARRGRYSLSGGNVV